MQKIKVIIADDHPVFLNGLRTLIESESSLKIVGEAFDGEQALKLIQTLKPDVAVLDVSMPDKNGFEIVRILQEQNTEINTIFLTMHDEEATFNTALELGVKGYILKDTALSEIISAIKLVAKGQNFITPKLSTFLMNKNRQTPNSVSQFEKLTSTEIKILRLIADHKTTREIAKELFVSHRTIDRHRYNICTKLKVRGVNSLIKFAIENKARFT